MRPLFHAGKDHYENTPGAEKDINIALNFVPPQLEQPKVDTRVDPNAPKDNEILLAGEKLSGSPEDIKAYTSLSDTARKILGKSFDEKSILSKVKDIKPEDKIT